MLICLLRDCLKIRECRIAGDFSTGQGERAVAIPTAGLSRPINAGQSEKTRNPSGESKKGRLAALPARSKPARGFSLPGALPPGLSCSRATFPNFQTVS